MGLGGRAHGRASRHQHRGLRTLNGLRWLRWVAGFELVSLLLLLGNVAALHNPALAAGVGPLHGAAYLTVIIALLVRDGTPGRPRLLAWVPGVGGFLALRALDGVGTGR